MPDYTITVDPMILALTGQSVGVIATRKVPVSPAALALTGQSVGVIATRRVPVSSAALTLTGQTVTVRKSYRTAVEPMLLRLYWGALVGSNEPSRTTAKYADWLHHPDSTEDLLPAALPTGGPSGGIGNLLRFDLTGTRALRRVAYVNRKLGLLRGTGHQAMSVRFDGATGTRAGLISRWNTSRLDGGNLCYMVELAQDEDGIRYRLRRGPAEDGEVLIQALLDPDYGFAENLWMEMGLALELTTTGSLKLVTLIRSNGVVSGHMTFGIGDEPWYTLGSVDIDRYTRIEKGATGWQILARTESGTVDVGHVRTRASSVPRYTLLTDDISLGA